MPQAPEELRAEWPGHDSEALEHLAPHFTVGLDGVIRPRDINRPNTEREYSAINYLILEWDYGYSGIPMGAPHVRPVRPNCGVMEQQQ